jgi:hypothetical protein
VILVPCAQAREWTDTARVAVDGTAPSTTGGELKILVEKEFRRLHAASDDPDLYPNPLEGRPAG